jgi:hypothetical protein
MRSFIFYTRLKCYSADRVMEGDVSGACGTHGRGEKSVQSFGGKARRKETTRKTES